MSRPTGSTSTPSYRCHRPSSQAVVTIDGRDHYLGPWKSKASRVEYDRLIGEWLANGRRSPQGGTPDLKIVELVAHYWRHASVYYKTPGDSHGELGALKLALHHLKKLYGHTLASDFGPLALKSLRLEMIEAGWCRNYVNCQIGRIKRMFRWAVEQEMVPPSLYHGLAAVAGLRLGKTEARESEPVKPVPEEYVNAIKTHVSRQVWAMIELQGLTGMRPGEVCSMRGRDLDTTGKLWIFTPESHKTQHHGHARTIYLGERAKAVVAPFLKPDLAAWLFSPIEAEAERRAAAHAARVENGTPLSCGNTIGTNRTRKPRRTPGERYDVNAYRRAIVRGCEIAFGMPADLQPKENDTSEEKKERKTKRAAWRAEHVWAPNQLRHNAGTRFRKDYGLEAAQVLLGHRTLTVTQVYAEKNVAAAQAVMEQCG